MRFLGSELVQTNWQQNYVLNRWSCVTNFCIKIKSLIVIALMNRIPILNVQYMIYQLRESMKITTIRVIQDLNWLSSKKNFKNRFGKRKQSRIPCYYLIQSIFITKIEISIDMKTNLFRSCGVYGRLSRPRGLVAKG